MNKAKIFNEVLEAINRFEFEVNKAMVDNEDLSRLVISLRLQHSKLSDLLVHAAYWQGVESERRCWM